MLNVFVKQFDLVALFTYFNAKQIAHREHSYPSIAVDNGEMPTANQLHAFEGLVRSLIALDHSPQLAGHVANSHGVGIAFGDDDTIHDVTLGKDAEQSAVVVDDTDSANVSLGHELGCFLHGSRSPGRVRLTVANHLSDQHRSCLLTGWLRDGDIINHEGTKTQSPRNGRQQHLGRKPQDRNINWALNLRSRWQNKAWGASPIYEAVSVVKIFLSTLWS
jgi:hypothetical protein